LCPKPSFFVSNREVVDRLGDETTCLIDDCRPKSSEASARSTSLPDTSPAGRPSPGIHMVDQDTRGTMPLDELREKFAATSAADTDA
jgi:hypothetical protein